MERTVWHVIHTSQHLSPEWHTSNISTSFVLLFPNYGEPCTEQRSFQQAIYKRTQRRCFIDLSNVCIKSVYKIPKQIKNKYKFLLSEWRWAFQIKNFFLWEQEPKKEFSWMYWQKPYTQLRWQLLHDVRQIIHQELNFLIWIVKGYEILQQVLWSDRF